MIVDLERAGFEPLLFGGWGEELLKVAAPRPHADVDVVLVAPSLPLLDSFVEARHEVVAGHLSHKRVYHQDGIKIELFIAHREGDRLRTLFWDRLRWFWPDDMGPLMVEGLPVAPEAALASFRANFANFMTARDRAAADPSNLE
ncbi:MAG: hypothetical protein ACRD0L_17140 [Acidimicrobiales bacterium]